MNAPPDSPEHILNVIRPLVRQAADRLLELVKSPLTTARKLDKTLVTNADHEIDRLLRNGLRSAFPDHSILTEESGLQRTESPYTWAVDPLDGTKAYAKGLPGFSVMVGLLLDGAPYLGAVADPIEGYYYEAARGTGCFVTDRAGRTQRVSVSSRASWDKMPVVTSTGFPDAARKALDGRLTGPFLEPINSVGIKVGLLVRQAADIYLNHHGVSYWDTCAPQIILEEAGGVFTAWDGSPLSYDLGSKPYAHTQPTVASNGARHAELCRLVTDIAPALQPSRHTA